MTKTTWRELEAKGIKRCCAMFKSGKRCRRRASETFGFSWCEKCGPMIKMHTDYANAAMTAQLKRDDTEEDGDDQ